MPTTKINNVNDTDSVTCSTNQSKHTPGPWEQIREYFDVAIIAKDSLPIAVVHDNERMTKEEFRSNAALIASAPEMYELLKEYQDRFQPMTPSQTEWQGRVCQLLNHLRVQG